jgi:hypothetical protein
MNHDLCNPKQLYGGRLNGIGCPPFLLFQTDSLSLTVERRLVNRPQVRRDTGSDCGSANLRFRAGNIETPHGPTNSH